MGQNSAIPWTIYIYGLIPCLGGLAFGYDTGSLSGILAMPQFLNYMNRPGNFTQGGITASIQAGAFFGSLFTGAFLADRFGRKKTILIGSLVFTIGIAISCAANGVPALVAGRVINGIGNGCLAMMVPLYQSEIAPLQIRGRIISLQQCFINLGILIAFWIQYGTSPIAGQAAFRIPIGLQMVPTIALHIAMYFLPESPRWLIQKGYSDKAVRVLGRLHAKGDIDSPLVQAEFSEIQSKLEFERQNKPPGYIDMLVGSEKRRTWLGIGVQFMQQVTGVNVHVWMDTWGRRKPMIIGGVGMGVAMMMIAVLMKIEGPPVFDALTQKTNFTFAHKSASHATIAFVYIYVATFSLTWGCVAWVYPPEVFSMNIRGRGTSMSSAMNWFVNFWFALYIPTAMNKISWRLYLVFMSLCYAMAVVVFLFYPESARKSLEEMDLLFGKDRSIWVLRDREATKVGGIIARDLDRGESLAITEKGADLETVEVSKVTADFKESA